MPSYRFTGPYPRVFGHLHFDTPGMSVDRFTDGTPCEGALLLEPGDVLHSPEPEVHPELQEIDEPKRRKHIPDPASTEPQE